jgi:hypothetical protein
MNVLLVVGILVATVLVAELKHRQQEVEIHHGC